MNGAERSNDGVKLKRCPFCGGEAIKSAFSWGNIFDEFTIECTVCGARTTVLKSEEVIKAWNNRKPLERVIARLEEESNFFRGEPMGTLQKAYYCMGVEKAIKIIKEEMM